MPLHSSRVLRCTGLGTTDLDHDSGAWLDLSPGSDTIHPARRQPAKACTQCVTTVRSDGNELHDRLTGHHLRCPKPFSAETFDQIPFARLKWLDEVLAKPQCRQRGCLETAVACPSVPWPAAMPARMPRRM